VKGTRDIVAKWVQAPHLSHDAPRPVAVAAPDDAEAGE
jgi:hypothetical protein